MGPSYSEKEVSHPISTQESERLHTSMALKSIQVLSMPLTLTERMAITCGRMLLMMDFTRKARWVLDGHKTPDPVGSKYAGVVSRESVRISFTYAALNDLGVCMADIRNA